MFISCRVVSAALSAAMIAASALAGSVVAPEAARAEVGAKPAPPPGPTPLTNFPAAFALSMLAPEQSPPGANDWSCKPSETHPEPVVLVHGTFANAYNAWAYVAPALKREGYCVYAVNYGGRRGNPIKGTGDIRLSARTLRDFVNRVRKASGARQVSLVGHSQGGMMPRWYLKYEGGTDPAHPERNKVARLVTLAGTHHGTSIMGVNSILDILGVQEQAGRVISTAAVQQGTGSRLLLALNRGGDTMPGVRYTVLGTRYDEVATPYRQTFLSAGPGASVHNVVLQNGCEVDLTDHLGITYDPRTLHYIKNALDPKRADTSVGRAATCQPFFPVAGPPLSE
ncbi:esterase/lipase family protein [Spirillospora sp. NPDC048911]|uniref:esterase/lipase family protein n=1 Tax=Spirillospora sp. NPDC048911 TaxID=3364527 RepID=UPI00371AB081